MDSRPPYWLADGNDKMGGPRYNAFMGTLMAFLGASIGGAIGWWLGDNIGGIWTALILSSIGTGVGYYLAKRFLAR